MPDLELRQLTYLIAVAETGSITRAAQRLLITQPALSRAIRNLERAVGVSLFVRRPHATELTVAGAELLTEAYEIVGRTRRAVDRARAGRTVRVAAGGCDVLTAMAAAGAFEQEHSVRVEIVPFDWRMDLAQLRSGAVDVALLRDCFDRGGLRLTPLSVEPRVMVLGERHPLALARTVTRADLEDQPIAYFTEMTPEERSHWAAPSSVLATPVASVSELVTELRLGRSVAFVHESAVPGGSIPGIVSRAVEGLSPSRLEAADLATPVARAFVTHLSPPALATPSRPRTRPV